MTAIATGNDLKIWSNPAAECETKENCTVDDWKEKDFQKIFEMEFEEERALYGVEFVELTKCKFDGPADGESCLKESKYIKIIDCDFNLRYPLWHTQHCEIVNMRMPETCRASMWYDKDFKVQDSFLHGIKAFRECDTLFIERCDILSEEFMWRCINIKIYESKIFSVYPFFECKNMEIEGSHITGKYSFQYVENLTIRNSTTDTKDAFWHAKNVTIYDSVIGGEYLAWYSENVRMIRCKISGTQPFCYCSKLYLEDCEMVGTDLSFERSDVHATIKGNILSVKNPISGRIEADGIGTVIFDKFVDRNSENKCEVVIRKQ